jgi:hypothetical protein
MNAWDNLPNGKRIDAVIAQYTAHYKKWDAAWYATRQQGLDKTWYAAWDASRHASQNAGRKEAWDAVGGAAGYAGGDTGQALVAWDEAGELLDMSVETVQVLAMVGIHAAVLLLPAVIAMNERK